MQKRTDAIRAIARKLLEEEHVDCVIGFREGTTPLRAQPFIAYTPDEAEELVWNDFCSFNTANLARKRKGRFAIVAQGCASRNLAGMVHEAQVEREQYMLLGVPCLGILDQRKIERQLRERMGGGHVQTVSHGGDSIRVQGVTWSGDVFSELLLRRDVMRSNCLTCLHRNPVDADELVAPPVEETAGGNIDAVATPWRKFDDPDKRWEQFVETFRTCIRCYACRDACPLCYCSVCFTEESDPQWCGKSQDAADVHTFHILRAFHCAGRCTDCGACESACPQGIPVRRMTSMLEADVRRLWKYEAGLDASAEPPLQVFSPDDPQEHFK